MSVKRKKLQRKNLKKEHKKRSKILYNKGRRVFVFDTEDDSKGNIYWIIFYDGEKYYNFKKADKAIEFITSCDENVVCFAVNLEYDIINLFRGHYEQLRWCFGRSKLISVKFKRWLFYDTLSHWKMSCAEMGSYIKAKKLPFNPKSKTYCQADCKVTYDFVAKMIKIYDSIGLELKATLPSTIYNYWLRNYSPFYLRRITDERLDIYKNTYYGGRTDCFFVGNISGHVRVIDVNSLYPYTMLNSYPNPYIVENTFNIEQFGISNVKVKVSQTIPVLPYRTKEGKLIYPNGTFKGWWTNDEIRYAVECGGVEIQKVYKSYTFPIECYPFDKFIKAFYDKRKNSKDALWNYTYKIAMNSLYGKFGQGKEKTNVISLKEYLSGKKLNSDNIAIFDNIVIYTCEDRYPINTNMVWAIYTTSYARIHLHKAMSEISEKGGKLLYCDTDSIFYESKKPLVKYGKELGQWKDEGVYKEAEIRLPKMYKLVAEDVINVKAKGVPKRKQLDFFTNGECTFQRPIKFKESLRRNITGNLWIDHTKRNNYVYNKGTIEKDGQITPLNIFIK